jgi:hypothetical protein
LSRTIRTPTRTIFFTILRHTGRIGARIERAY